MNSAQHAAGLPVSRPAWWVAARQWRNWPLLVKLGMVLVVPVVAAVLLGVLRVRGDVELANSYAEIERIATMRAELVPLMSAIQRERNAAVQHQPGIPSEYSRLAGETDVIVGRLDDLVEQTPDLGETATNGYRELTRSVNTLRPLRNLVNAGGYWFVVLGGYGEVASAVLDFDRALVERFPHRELTGTATALHDLQDAREQVGVEQAIGLIGLRTGALTGTQREMLIEAGIKLDDTISDFRAVAPAQLWQRYQAVVAGRDVDTRESLVLATRGVGTVAMPFTTEKWTTTSDATTGLMADVAREAAAELRSEAATLHESISNRAGAQSVLLLAMVLLATGIGGVLGRYLLRSVKVLRTTALDVAANRLPAAVASIRAGKTTDLSVDPVPLHTTEELGQLARAFDTVHGQAVASAAEEARLRSNLRNIFVNLSRRSQGLVERQLRLMEQLEDKADDPDQLANLFKLDHLATRMRRNNENLMVLSGMELGRRFTQHPQLQEVLRAAVSEVEQYQRVVVRSVPQARVVSYAASDLVRSVAELVENATAFSPPESQVIVTSRLTEDGGVLIDILDQGIGMEDAELAEANERVAAGGDVLVPISRQMGLFVVGNLTSRQGIRVRLGKRDGDTAGLRAALLVPPELIRVESADEPSPEPVEPAAGMSANGVVGKLESAGIVVRLPDFPVASSPASILFTPRTPVEPAGSPAPSTQPVAGFAWLGPPTTPQPALPPQPALSAPAAPTGGWADGPAGLPKRVPKAQLIATQTPRGRPTAAQPVPSRDPARARGFLSSFQAGIRQGEKNRDEEHS